MFNSQTVCYKVLIDAYCVRCSRIMCTEQKHANRFLSCSIWRWFVRIGFCGKLFEWQTSWILCSRFPRADRVYWLYKLVTWYNIKLYAILYQMHHVRRIYFVILLLHFSFFSHVYLLIITIVNKSGGTTYVNTYNNMSYILYYIKKKISIRHYDILLCTYVQY